jgi:hypothetical protein
MIFISLHDAFVRNLKQEVIAKSAAESENGKGVVVVKDHSRRYSDYFDPWPRRDFKDEFLRYIIS